MSKSFKMMMKMPTEAEIESGCLRSYEAASFTYMDRWSPALRDMSIPSIAVSISPEQTASLLSVADHGKCDAVVAALADRLDGIMGWRNYFVRLNTRSPKDASFPAVPITCAGKQAISWIVSSMRTFDDLCMLHGAKKPAFIFLRNVVHIPEEWELRCFVKAGRMIAATQYYAKATNADLQDADTRTGLQAKLAEQIRTEVVPAVGHEDFVVDMIPGPNGWRVLEINPYGMSDPILFKNYTEVETDGGFRIKSAGPTPSGSPPDSPPAT